MTTSKFSAFFKLPCKLILNDDFIVNIRESCIAVSSDSYFTFDSKEINNIDVVEICIDELGKYLIEFKDGVFQTKSDTRNNEIGDYIIQVISNIFKVINKKLEKSLKINIKTDKGFYTKPGFRSGLNYKSCICSGLVLTFLKLYEAEHVYNIAALKVYKQLSPKGSGADIIHSRLGNVIYSKDEVKDFSISHEICFVVGLIDSPGSVMEYDKLIDKGRIWWNSLIGINREIISIISKEGFSIYNQGVLKMLYRLYFEEMKMRASEVVSDKQAEIIPLTNFLPIFGCGLISRENGIWCIVNRSSLSGVVSLWSSKCKSVKICGFLR